MSATDSKYRAALEGKIPAEYASEKLDVDAEHAYSGTSTELDPAAVGKLRWKIDIHLIPLIAVLYLCSFLDRVNIGKCRPFCLLLYLHGMAV